MHPTRSRGSAGWVPAGSPSVLACRALFAAATLANRQPLFAIQPVHLLQVHAFALPPEQDRRPPRAEPAALVGDLAHPRPHNIVALAQRLILPCRPVDADQPAGATVGEAAVGQQLLHRSVAIHRRSQFFPLDGSAPTRPASTPLAASSAVGSHPPAPATWPRQAPSARYTSTSSCRTSHR